MIKKCLFPAAGYGTRFLPATKATPKEMLPILTKPLIQYGVEEALEAGIHTMAIVTRRGKHAIEDHFDISYSRQVEIKDLRDTILTLDIFDIIHNTELGKGGETQITDALLEQAKQGNVIACKFKGKYFDCGTIDAFVEVTNYLYKKVQ